MRDRRALVELAFLLPFAGAALLLPQVLGVFAGGTGPAGVPALVGYVFAVWLGLILINLIVARALGRPPRPGGTDPSGKTGD